MIVVDRAGFGPAASRCFGFVLANRAFFGPATTAWYTRLNYLPIQRPRKLPAHLSD